MRLTVEVPAFSGSVHGGLYRLVLCRSWVGGNPEEKSQHDSALGIPGLFLLLGNHGHFATGRWSIRKTGQYGCWSHSLEWLYVSAVLQVWKLSPLGQEHHLDGHSLDLFRICHWLSSSMCHWWHCTFFKEPRQPFWHIGATQVGFFLRSLQQKAFWFVSHRWIGSSWHTCCVSVRLKSSTFQSTFWRHPLFARWVLRVSIACLCEITSLPCAYSTDLLSEKLLLGQHWLEFQVTKKAVHSRCYPAASAFWSDWATRCYQPELH